MKQHCQFVICLVEDYLKHLTSIYAEQRQIRVKRALDKCKVSKLESFCKRDSHQNNDQLMNNNLIRKRNRARSDSLNGLTEDENEETSNQIAESNPLITEQYEDEEHLLDQLTQEELQVFEQENDQLFDELNALTDEVR